MRGQTAPLSSSVKELIGHTLMPLLEMYETEDHKLVIYFLHISYLSLEIFFPP
jgi:hypothetical protein